MARFQMPPDDLTPAEADIKTVQLDTGPSGSGRMDVNTLVRARSGARESAFNEAHRNFDAVYKAIRRGVVLGAIIVAATVAVTCALIYSWLTWSKR